MRAFNFGVDDAICLNGYRGDNVARPVIIREVHADRVLCQCLMRSTALVPVLHTYLVRYINGVRPLIGVKT